MFFLFFSYTFPILFLYFLIFSCVFLSFLTGRKGKKREENRKKTGRKPEENRKKRREKKRKAEKSKSKKKKREEKKREEKRRAPSAAEIKLVVAGN
jgi:hypothetical protein